MRYIKKGDEPAAFRDWKARANEDWQPTWEVLRNPEKRAVKQALLDEQGYLCAYCCQYIEYETSHIDHVEPRAARSDLALAYENMLASCPGEPAEGDDPEPRAQRLPELKHCGHAKADWYDPERFVDPRDPDCEKAFSFTVMGQIRVAPAAPNPEAARETIERLKLDYAPLRRQREAAIAVELERLVQRLQAAGRLSREDITARIEQLQRRGDDGRFAAFMPAILDILKQRASTLR